MSETTDETLVYEGDVADQLGLDRKALAKVRQGLDLEKGVDWEHGAHRRLMYRPEGFKKICAAVEREQAHAAGAESGASDEPCIEGEPVGGDSVASAPMPVMPRIEPRLKAPEKFEARVVRVPRFPKLLECQAESRDEEILRVKVQNNENFKPGMVVPVREALGQGPGVYYYDGVLPKRKGVLPAIRQTKAK